MERPARLFLVSPEVRAHIPSQVLASWESGPNPQSFRCVVCGSTDLVDGGVPVAVCFLTQAGLSGLILIHAGCGPSAIWHTAPPSMLAERLVFVQRLEPTPKCLLVIVLESQLVQITPDASEHRSVPLSHALASGFELVLEEPLDCRPALA